MISIASGGEGLFALSAIRDKTPHGAFNAIVAREHTASPGLKFPTPTKVPQYSLHRECEGIIFWVHHVPLIKPDIAHEK